MDTMIVLAVLLFFGVFVRLEGVESGYIKPMETCDGVPCVCYTDLGCFPVRAECGEGPNSRLPDTPASVDTRFFLFTSKSQTDGKALTYDMQLAQFLDAGFDPAVETKVIIHGFSSSSNSKAVKDVRDAFLKMGKYNIIMVDWRTGLNYAQAIQDLRVVAKTTELLLLQLSSEVGVEIKAIHILGHSLGAHTSGLTGAHLGGGVGRITGLDPAGPDFGNEDPSCRIDATDAVFVDIIHTDKDAYGTDVQCGDIDFWPNDGTNQPGCGSGICSHNRVSTYFAVTIEGLCTFNTYECGSTSCSDGNCPAMGIDADKSSKRGNFCLTTGSQYPFC